MGNWCKMSDGLTASLVSAAALVIVAYVTYWLTRRSQDRAAWRTEKLEYYKEFVDALAMNVEGDDTEDTHLALARASNNLLLIAPKSVLQAHHAFREQIGILNKKRNHDLDAPLLADLLNAIRADLEMPTAAPLPIELVRLWTSGRLYRVPRSD